MRLQDAAEDAIARKILARMERCPWELIRAARRYQYAYPLSGEVHDFRDMLRKYAERLPEWLED